MRVPQILRDDAGRQTVLGRVRPVDRLLQRTELQNLLARTEDLFFGDRVMILHVREHGRFDKVAVAGIAPDLATGLQFGALLNAGLHQGEDLFELGGVNLRTLLGGIFERIAHTTLFGQRHTTLYELIVDRLVHERSTASTAHLTLVEKHGPMRDLHRLVQIGICTDHVRRFATQLEGDTLDVRRCGQ